MERARTGDRGSAVVDFALVGGLLTVLFVAVLQFVLVLYTRNVLVDCAGEGARYGARSGQGAAAAEQRTREEISAALADRYGQDVRAGFVRRDGLTVMEVRVRAPLPVAGLIGAGRTLTVTGHAVAEDPGDG